MSLDHPNLDRPNGLSKATQGHCWTAYFLGALLLVIGLFCWAVYLSHGFFYVYFGIGHGAPRIALTGAEAVILIELTARTRKGWRWNRPWAMSNRHLNDEHPSMADFYLDSITWERQPAIKLKLKEVRRL